MDRGGIRRNYRRIKSVGPCLAGCALPITPIDTTKPWSPRATDCHPAFGPGVVWRRIQASAENVRFERTPRWRGADLNLRALTFGRTSASLAGFPVLC
jgi:hypothetical protein